MTNHTFSRRQLLASTVSMGTGLTFLSPLLAVDADLTAADAIPADAKEAIKRLVTGNKRFVAGKPLHNRSATEVRKELAGGQQPFAAILGCSDSRVPAELVFDQGLGDLFIVRNAGNVVADDVLGSLEYAAPPKSSVVS